MHECEINFCVVYRNSKFHVHGGLKVTPWKRKLAFVGVYKETGQYFVQLFVIYWMMQSQVEFFFGIEREMVMFTS